MIDRLEATRSMRKFCDLLDAHDDIPLPYEFNKVDIHFLGDVNALDGMTRVRRIIGGRWDKRPWDSYFTLDGMVGSIKVCLTSFREAVCTRVVVDTRTTTRDIPDPDVVDQRPLVRITETIEDVEWVCPDSLVIN